MQARDVMTTTVVSVGPESEVREIAKPLAEHRISAVPVVDSDGKLVGIVSEGDQRVNIVVSGGIVHVWGPVITPAEKEAIRVAVESARGVKDIRDNVAALPPDVRARRVGHAHEMCDLSSANAKFAHAFGRKAPGSFAPRH